MGELTSFLGEGVCAICSAKLPLHHESKLCLTCSKNFGEVENVKVRKKQLRDFEKWSNPVALATKRITPFK